MRFFLYVISLCVILLVSCWIIDTCFACDDKLNSLTIDTRAKAKTLLALAKIEFPHHRIIVAECFRSISRQDALYKKGSSTTTVRGGYSWHNYGRAVDLYFVDSEGKILAYENAPYLQLGTLGESLGFVWGGRWKVPFDPGHFQYQGRYSSIKQLQNGG